MTRTCPVDRCDAELTADEIICRGSAARLRGQLRAIPELLDELDTTLARIGSTWSEPGEIRGRATGGCKPGCDHAADSTSCVAGVSLDVNLAASEAAAQLRIVLHGWARVWDEETPLAIPDSAVDLPAARRIAYRMRAHALGTAGRQALLLADQPLAGRAWAPELADEVGAAVRRAERAIDRPADVTLAGTCTCGMSLYAEVGSRIARCRWCGVTSDYDGSRAAMLAKMPAAYERTLPKPELAQLVGIPVGTLHRWSSENRIIAQGYNEKGQPLFLVGPIAKAAQSGVPPERAARPLDILTSTEAVGRYDASGTGRS